MDTKSWYLSRTIWAGLVMVLAALLKIFGHDLPADVQSALPDQLIAAVSLISGFVAIWGRVKATKAISSKSGQ